MNAAPTPRRCQRCKKRRIKCDLNWPTCGACHSSDTVCSGPPSGAKFVNYTPSSSSRAGGTSKDPLSSSSTLKTDDPCHGEGTTYAFFQKGQLTSQNKDSTDSHSPSTESRKHPAALVWMRPTGQGLAEDSASTTIPSDRLGRYIVPARGNQSRRGEHSKKAKLPMYTVPHGMMQDFATAVVKAIHFYNTEMVPLHDPGTGIWPPPDPMPLLTLSLEPLSVQHTLVSFAMGLQVMLGPALARHSRVLASTELAPLHHHRLEAIQALNYELGKKETKFSLATLTCIALFFEVEMNQGINVDWQPHIRAIWAIMRANGGLSGVINNRPDMVPFLPLIVKTGHMSNTTCPPLRQVREIPGLEDIGDVLKGYRLRWMGSFPCPEALFTEVLRINELRYKQAQLGEDGTVTEITETEAKSELPSAGSKASSGVPPIGGSAELLADATALILRIMDFDSVEWSQLQPAEHREEWARLGHLHKAAIFLFATHSLQASYQEPKHNDSSSFGRIVSSEIESCHWMAREVEKDMRDHKHIPMYWCWPIVVLGVAAKTTCVQYRELVLKTLVVISRDHGTTISLTAREALERFWYSAKRDWNDCFDQPCVVLQ